MIIMFTSNIEIIEFYYGIAYPLRCNYYVFIWMTKGRETQSKKDEERVINGQPYLVSFLIVIDADST